MRYLQNVKVKLIHSIFLNGPKIQAENLPQNKNTWFFTHLPVMDINLRCNTFVCPAKLHILKIKYSLTSSKDKQHIRDKGFRIFEDKVEVVNH